MHDRLPHGTGVITVRPEQESTDWLPSALVSRQWDVHGVVVADHDAHGLTYEVRHPDGSIGHYEPRELRCSGTGEVPGLR